MTPSWKLTIAADYDEFSRTAADRVQETIERHPGCAITLPTGGTPIGMYEELVRRIRGGALEFGDTQLFCLDDYLGKSIDDADSLTGWLRGVFLEPAGIPLANTHFIPADAADPVTAAAAYDAEIAVAGGLDLAVLGLGPNGHIGFNEPGSPVDSRTRVLTLTEESRDQNAAYYEDGADIPDKAMTIGIATLLEARRIVLIVNGENKIDILRAAFEGPETPDVPGSFLRRAGERLEIIVDREAAPAFNG